MSVSGIGQNYGYLGTATNYMKKKIPVREEIPKTAEQSASLSISNNGKNALQEMTIKNTNEVAWEHYMAMRDISSLTLKDGNYSVEDVMKSIMDTYESRYNEIIKEHNNGNREVSYELTGKRLLTLDEDLAGLDEAFKMRLANLEGYITCQQTNKAFENPDSSWYFRRNVSQNEIKTQDKVEMPNIQYQKTAVSIMEQVKEKFLVDFGKQKRDAGFQAWIL